MNRGWGERLAAARTYAGLARWLGLDLRALAVLRLLLGLLLLASLFDRLREFTAFYTDAGIVSQAEAWSGDTWRLPWNGRSSLQPFAWLPDPWGSGALFLGAAAAAVFLCLGWHTRLATLAGWLMLTGLDNRNPLVLNAGDDVLRLFLFWSLFLPLGARWSLDARSAGWWWNARRSNRFVSVGTLAFLVQLASIYFFSAHFKSYRYWVIDGDAMHYALRLEQFVTPWGVALRDWLPGRPASVATWWLELVGPLLLFSPLATGTLRYGLFLAFTALHLGIDATLGIGLFSYVCIAGWLAVLPFGFWRGLERRLGLRRRVAPAVRNGAEGPPGVDRWLLLPTLLLLYGLAWNVWTLAIDSHAWWFPPAARQLGYQLRLGQLWGMFSPGPPKNSNWIEIVANTQSGQFVPLAPDGRPSEPPPATPERAVSERWRKLHEHLVQRRRTRLEEDYAAFLLRQAQQAHGAVAGVTLTWVTVPIPAPGAEPKPPKLEIIAQAGEPPRQPPPRVWPGQSGPGEVDPTTRARGSK